MTICRYFLQGRCRFGDRCKFEHTGNSYDSYDGQKNIGQQYGQASNNQHYYENRYDQYGYSDNLYGKQRNYSPDRYSVNYQYDSQPKYGTHISRYNNNYNNKYTSNSPDRYSENSYYDPHSTYSGSYRHPYQNQYNGYLDRYSENYQYDSQSTYSGTYRNQYNNNYNQKQHSYSPERYENYKSIQGSEEYSRYNEQNYGTNQQYQTNNSKQDSIYGQNKFKWLSEDYRKQNKAQTLNHNETYSTSTPKGKVPFSFKVPESEIKNSFSNNYVDENDQLHAELVKEDSKAWEHGGQWPFTCYFPIPDKHCFPGFCDISPEELRYSAYKAEKNNVYESYVQSVQNALHQINEQRSQLQILTPQLLNTLRRIWSGENLYCTPNYVVSIPFVQFQETRADVTDAPSTVPSSSSAAASFSFKVDIDTISAVKSAAGAFTFKHPASNDTLLNVDVEIYTPLEDLTEEEKEQFSAPIFVLGKIPTKPPPQELCT